MKIMHHLVRTLALSAVLGGLLVSAQAQVGSGWNTRWYPSYDVQERGSGDVSGSTFRLTSSASSGEHRAERRYQTTTSGQSQMEGTVKIVSMGGDRISIAQCFKDNSTPNSILAFRKPNVLYQVRHGGKVLGNVSIGSTIRVNTTINTSNGVCEIYLNGSRKDGVSEGGGDYYHKLGAYRTASGRGPATVEWTNIRFWKK
jgi:hypothetical protein